MDGTREKKELAICRILAIEAMQGDYYFLQDFRNNWTTIFEEVAETDNWENVPDLYIDLVYKWAVDNNYIEEEK